MIDDAAFRGQLQDFMRALEATPLGPAPPHLFKRVKDHMGWDDAKTALWFKTPNPLIGGDLSPIAFYALRPRKAEKWIEDLVAGASA